MSKAGSGGLRGWYRSRSSISSSRDNLPNDSITPSGEEKEGIIAEIDKREIPCFVCKAPLKRMQSRDEIMSGSKKPLEELFTCKNGHVFSAQGIFHLRYYYEHSY